MTIQTFTWLRMNSGFVWLFFLHRTLETVYFSYEGELDCTSALKPPSCGACVARMSTMKDNTDKTVRTIRVQVRGPAGAIFFMLPQMLPRMDAPTSGVMRFKRKKERKKLSRPPPPKKK